METILLSLTGAAWAAVEVSLRVRDRVRGKGGRSGDRGTRALGGVLLLAAVLGAVALGAVVGPYSALRLPGAGPWLPAAGLLAMWLGLALRVWAVSTLGGAFRTTVEVDSGQPVVQRGPYRLVRHPSYTGLLLLAAGYGLAFGTWPGLLLCLVLPEVGLLRRIGVEEAAMLRVLGDPYRTYRERTKRLVPGVW